ncbi:MAG: AAA family ATPase, partial [Gammaproteobacteria bacterium]
MYQEFFGLSGKPFQLSPDASFFYASREHKRALAFLEYGLAQADGFIVVTGDVGTGKSTLAQTLLQKLDPKRILVANIVTTLLKEDDLLHLVAANLGLRVTNPSKAILLRELERLFQQQAREGRRVLILVDEAQNLPPGSVEELRMLSNFTLNSKPLVQIFLLGQQEFRDTLLGPGFEQLRQRVIATHHLNPLDEAETRTYVEHRLRRVGGNN